MMWLAALLLAQAEVDVTLRLVEDQGAWTFRIEGSTSLPPATVLQARVWALDPEGGEEPLVREDEPGQSAVLRFPAGSGKIRQDLYRFARKPYSIPYRVRVTDGNVERDAELPGSDADYERELQVRVRELAEDLQALERARVGPREGLAALEARNRERFDLWTVWVERSGKMAVGGLLELLRRADEAPGEARRRELMRAFDQILKDAIDRTGVDIPLDPGTLLPKLAAYEALLAPLRAGAASSKEFRREGIDALFALLVELERRTRGYVHLNETARRFARIVERVDAGAPAAELRAALDEHDRALAAFKAFAGLK